MLRIQSFPACLLQFFLVPEALVLYGEEGLEGLEEPLQGSLPRSDSVWVLCYVWWPAGASMALGVWQPGLLTRIFHNLTPNSKTFVYHQSLHVSPFLYLSQDKNGVNFTHVTLAQVSSRLLFNSPSLSG